MTTIRNTLAKTIAFALAATVTLAMLGGVNHLATVEQGAMLVQKADAPRA